MMKFVKMLRDADNDPQDIQILDFDLGDLDQNFKIFSPAV
jgi:hypothetical protein